MRAPITISIFPVETNGILSGEPTLTSSSFTPNISASFAPISGSNPTKLFFSSYFASGGKPGFTPIFNTPELNISSSDLASTDAVIDTKTVNAINDAPVIEEIEEILMNEDEEKQIPISVSDPDYVSLSYQIEYSENIVALLENDILNIVPVENYFGNETVTITVLDDQNFQATQTIPIVINAVTDAPVLYAIYLAGPPMPEPISSTDFFELI